MNRKRQHRSSSLLLLVIHFLIGLANTSLGQTCSLDATRDSLTYSNSAEMFFYVGDTVRFSLRVKGQGCPECFPVCLNCDKLEYTLADGHFSWLPDFTQKNIQTTLKFSLTCPRPDSVRKSMLYLTIHIVKFPHQFELDFQQNNPPSFVSHLTDFMSNKSARIAQMIVNEGDTISFRLSTIKNSPGKLMVIQSNPSFDGIIYADTKSMIVFWVPSYKDFKINPFRELRFSLANGALSSDPEQVSKVIKFKITLRHNLPPIPDKSRPGVVNLETRGDTYINLADYFVPAYSKEDDPLQFDYSPKNLSCIKVSPYNKNELVIKKLLYLNEQLKPTELVIRARHSNSPLSAEVHLALKSNYEALSMTLENRKFSFYDDDKIDELIKVDFNEPYHLEPNQTKVLGDTNLYDLKKVIRFDDQNPQFLRMYTTKNVEIDDAVSDELRFSVFLKFVNDLNKESLQNVSISIHPRVNGDIARSYFKKQIDSLRVLQKNIKSYEVRINKTRDHLANRIDWYSKGISFAAIIIGSYGTAKNQANYGYSIMAGLALGALFVDLKDIHFFLTKKYQKAKKASDELTTLESDVEKHLIADTDKMGISYFEANYRQSESREYGDLVNTYQNILKEYDSNK